MTHGIDAIEARLGAVIGGVLRQLLEDSGADGVLILEDGSPEAGLALRWAVRAVGEQATRTIPSPGLLVAESVNKTALLLEPAVRTGAVLPLGDVYASQVGRLAGGWTASAATRELAARAGGIDLLDRALADWCDRRVHLAAALAPLPAAVRPDVATAIERARFARRTVPLVPKLAARTAGIDLFA